MFPNVHGIAGTACTLGIYSITKDIETIQKKSIDAFIDNNRSLAIEAKSPLDLDRDLGLPRGNIFHRDLDFPFIDGMESQNLKWGSETDDPHIFLAGAGARRGGGVSAIAGHNAAMAVLAND